MMPAAQPTNRRHIDHQKVDQQGRHRHSADRKRQRALQCRAVHRAARLPRRLGRRHVRSLDARLTERHERRRRLDRTPRKALTQVTQAPLQVQLARRHHHMLAIVLHQHLDTRIGLIQQLQSRGQLGHVGRTPWLQRHTYHRRSEAAHTRQVHDIAQLLRTADQRRIPQHHAIETADRKDIARGHALHTHQISAHHHVQRLHATRTHVRLIRGIRRCPSRIVLR